MKFIFSITLILNSILLHSQVIESYQLKDSVLVLGEKYTEDNISQQKLNLKDLYSIGLVNSDLMHYLKVIGINTTLDFNAIPYMEGADFHEQQFFINNIPIPFQSRLIGLQSGLNSLLFSQISIVESHSLRNYGKPIKLKLKTSKIDTSKLHVSSKINILNFENAVSVPINNLNGGITIGYNRSLLETIKPFFGRTINKNDFEYKKFPFFQGFQVLAEFRINDIHIRPIFIYTEDIGTFGISTNQFNFYSHNLNYGVEIQTESSKLKNSIQIYSNMGKNNIDYKFIEPNNIYVTGKANLSFGEFGFSSNIEYLIKPRHTLTLSLGYKHQDANSENRVSFTNTNNSKFASYSSDIFKSTLYYQNLLSDKLLSTLHIGLNSFKFNNIYPSLGLDMYYSDPILFDARFQISYESFQEPINPIFFSFQNTIWDPSSTSSLFFVDNSNLPLKPIKCLNTSLNLRKQISTSFLETNVSIKLFLRHLKNLIYANSYPDEVTIYNSDFGFNQNFDGIRYGLSFLIANNIASLSLKNMTSVNLFKSINHDYKNENDFYSLNYSPITIANFTQYQLSNFFVNLLFTYSSGRYLFNKKIQTNYSLVDSTYSYSLTTDYATQLNLTPYYRMDISFLYKIIRGDLNLGLGLSFLNVFDNKNESRRNIGFDTSNRSLTEKSDYFNLPRFLVFEISMRLKL